MIGSVTKTLAMISTNEVLVEAASGSVCSNQTSRQVSRTGVDGITRGNICDAISVKHTPTPVAIGSPTMYPSSGISEILQVANKRQSVSPSFNRNDQKLDTVVDGKSPKDQDSLYIFSKLIDIELSHGYRYNLYLRCQMNFMSDVVQTEAPQFVDLGILAVNRSNEFGVLGTPTTRMRRPSDVSHLSAPDHAFGEATAFVMRAPRSDRDYSYKNEFQIWK